TPPARQAPLVRPPDAVQPTPALMPPPVAPPALPPADGGAQLRILPSDKQPSFHVTPPAANRADIPYLPAGAFAEGAVITGVLATSRGGGALPVLFAVSREFHPPYQLRGPDRNPLATMLPLQGCFMFGKAQADLGAG